ncbi:MAG: hypothetical protein KDD60_10525, partial [Bdellovibrionales bacterium]|nr:hypothetical protein [Bdellovibrionales bacterium]
MKILVVSESVSIAHIIRPAAIANIAQELGHSVDFASDKTEFSPTLHPKIRHLHLPSIGSKTFLRRIRRHKIPYTYEDLQHYHSLDSELLSKSQPDFIIADFRYSIAFRSSW